MATHELKCWPNAFEAIRDGRKRFEWRRDDRGFEVGDMLVLLMWDPERYTVAQGKGIAEKPHGDYDPKIKPLCVRVTYILRGLFDVPAGFCVMSIELVGGDDGE